MIAIVDEKYIQVGSGSSHYVEILCLSTDTKPTSGIATNSLAQELDTNKTFYFNGTAWAEIGA